MVMDARRSLGDLGESIAAAHLAARGYRVLARNFRTRSGELDVVAARAGVIVFCEVKTRVAGGRRGPAGPLDAIGPHKRRRLRRMAREWLASDPSRGGARRDQLRFDAIGVTVTASGRLLALDHVEGAF
jgi:putative endonuclease